MERLEKEVDLSLVLGTSLSGMNADRMASTPAKRMLRKQALGTVLVNLQQTWMDDICAIRVWAKLDVAFKILADKLGLLDQVVTHEVPWNIPANHVALVPYNAEGKLDNTCRMMLDMR